MPLEYLSLFYLDAGWERFIWEWSELDFPSTQRFFTISQRDISGLKGINHNMGGRKSF